MKFTSGMIKRAWAIRRAAAEKFSCPIMEIAWGECLRIAKKENKMSIYDDIISHEKNQCVGGGPDRIARLAQIAKVEGEKLEILPTDYESGNLVGMCNAVRTEAEAMGHYWWMQGEVQQLCCCIRDILGHATWSPPAFGDVYQFNTETGAEILIASGLPSAEAEKMAKELNKKATKTQEYFVQ